MTRRKSAGRRNLKLVLEYDGTRYAGFQRQKNAPTIQSQLEVALKRLFQSSIRLYASGRTDSGVHAEGQVVHIETTSSLPTENIQRALNQFLPKDIAVLNVRAVRPDFHAQFSAKRKIYEYRIWNAKVRSPLLNDKSFFYPHRLSIADMKRAAKRFVGRHDFKVFQSSGSVRRSTVRTVTSCQIRKNGGNIYIKIESNGFLYRMMRNMVGALIAVGSGKLTDRELVTMIRSGKRGPTVTTVPPQGLTLKRVKLSGR